MLRAAILATISLILFFSERAGAFSLLGPYEDWMSSTNGFMKAEDIGGPMDINQGYRWNVPVVTYAFDQSFIDCFGSNGVAAVESAIQILNDLPPASQIDLDSYPLDTTAINVAAATASLADLKSTTLTLLLQELGLAPPTRFTFCIHDFYVTNGMVLNSTTTVVQRNFDPVSFQPSDFVNGTEYSYWTIYGDYNGQMLVEPEVFAIDPLAPPYNAVADNGGEFNYGRSPGSFYTGLTRDDVGGLRFLLRTNNFQFETLLADVHGAGTNAGSYVNVAYRAGVDKITFIRQDYDPLLGEAYMPLTNQFIDTYLTNGTVRHQQLERIVSTPDIIFTVSTNLWNEWGYQCTGTSNWLNHSDLEGFPNSAGPGTICPPINIAFQPNVESIIFTDDSTPGNNTSISQIRWASFDRSSNSPVVYPVENFQKSIDSVIMNLQINGTDPSSISSYSWESPIPFGQSLVLQTSTNLANWTTTGVVTNYGLPVAWIHNASIPVRFFRVLPGN